jgi:hypothetical protein
MKKLLGVLIVLICISCKKEIIQPKPIAEIQQPKKDTTQNPTQQKVGFVIDSVWFKKNYPGFWIETHNGNGEGDFNKDGRKDLVVMFATNSEAKYLFQKDTSSRIVIGVFINNKTYFELDTNLVYSYLGGYSGVNVSDLNNDGYLDFYQMTGYWEGSQFGAPSYYNNSGHGGMDSYVYLNDKNKSLKRYTLPNQNDGGSTTSIVFDNNKNGFSEIYLSSCLCYFEFNGKEFLRNELSLDKSFKNNFYNMNVLTPKYADKNAGVIYTAENIYGDTYFILKVEGNKLTPKIKYQVPHPQSGPAQEIYVEDLNKDGKLEYIIPTEISSNSNNTKPAVPYLMIVDENGNDVSKTFMDEEITKPLSYEQINWIGETWQTGFIYHTFADVDNDGIKEIFAASGVGYKKGNDTYYYKLIDGKYKLQFYHSGWLGDVHKSKGYINYKTFVDEKNGVNIFLTIEKDLHKSIFKTF